MRRIIKWLFVALNFVVALLLFVSTLSGSVPPSCSIVPSLLSYAFFPLLLLNVCCIVLWLLSGRWWFLLSTLAILLRCSFVPLYFQIGSDALPAEGNVLTVMSNNVHGFYGSAFVSDMDKDLNQISHNGEQFLAIVDSTQPDVMCLLEFHPRAHALAMSDSLVARGYKYNVSAHPGRRIAGTVVWSRYPLWQPYYLDSADMVAVHVVKGRDTICLVNVHLESIRLYEIDYRQGAATWHGHFYCDCNRSTLRKLKKAAQVHERQWQQVEPLLQESPYPCLLAGDFNDTPASHFYQRAKQYLQDSYQAQGEGFGTTYHGTFPAFRIDYLLYDPAVTVLDYRRIKSDHSDHYPLVATYRLGDSLVDAALPQQK